MRYKPNKGHAFYFPMLGKVVIGEPINISFFASRAQKECKHIQIGDFTIKAGFGKKFSTPPIKTLDNFLCEIDVIFRIKVGETPEMLKKATRGISTEQTMKETITHNDFIGFLNTKIEDEIVKTIGKLTYNELSQPIDEKIRENVGGVITEEGFILYGCQANILSIVPNEILLGMDKKLKERWDEYLKETLAIVERNKQADLAKERVNKDAEIQIEKMNLDNEIKKAELKSAFEISKMKIKEKNKEEELNSQKLLTGYDLSIREEYAKIQREEITRKHEYQNIENEQIRKIRESEILDEIKNTQSSLERDKLKIEAETLLNAINQLSSERAKINGEVEADIIKLKTIAESASKLEFNRLLLQELPKILEKATSTFSKVSDAKIIYLGGNQSLQNGLTDSSLSSLMTSLSALPMMKEILGFLNDWGKPIN
jgi:hypothetical protein